MLSKIPLQPLENRAGDGLCPLGCRVAGSLLHILCQKAMKEEPQSRIMWRHDFILLAIYKGVKDRIKEAVESRGEEMSQLQTNFQIVG